MAAKTSAPRDAGGTLWDWPNQQVVRADHSGPGIPAVVPATGANAGIPGSWLPQGATPPASPAALAAGTPNAVEASPATAWTTGQYVQTGTAGVPGRASWSGTTWVGGAAP